MNFTASIPPIAEKLSKKSRQKYFDYGKIIPSITTSFDNIISTIIPDIAKDLVDLEKLKLNFCNTLSGAKILNLDLFDSKEEKEILNTKLIYDVDAHPLKNIKVIAIDGSNVSNNFYGCDIALLHTIGVIYHFDHMGKLDVSYFPINGIENYKVLKIMKNSSEQEISSQISIERNFMEINLANQMILDYLKNPEKDEKTRKCVDLIILDGSILAEPVNVNISQDSSYLAKYSNLFKEYKKLYSLCNSENITLVGVVKDTRSSTFISYLKRRLPYILRNYPILEDITNMNYRKLLKYFSDLDFFHRILQPGERSAFFSIKSGKNLDIDFLYEKEQKNQTLNVNSMNDYEFYACYLKSVEYDFPVRFEFTIRKNDKNNRVIKETVEKIASFLLPLSSKMEDFNLPLPQIEAHLRAKLSETDLKTILKYLEREITKQVSKSLNDKMLVFNSITNVENFDIFTLKNRLLIPKRRNRLPI